MPRSNFRHLTAAAVMTLGVGACCAPVAWALSRGPGLKVVAASGLAILLVAALSDAFTWLLRGVASPAVAMVASAACRMLFVIGVMFVALNGSLGEWAGDHSPRLAIYLIPFYFGLLVVEVFTAKTVLSGSPDPRPAAAGARTPHPTA